MLSVPKVNVPALLQPCTKTNMRLNVVKFINENEGILSAYRADEIDCASPPINRASSSNDQKIRRIKLSPGQRADGPISPNYEEYSIIGQTAFASFEEPLKPNLATSNNESGRLQRMQSSHLERKRREKSPELKFQTFQKSPNFDTFRPLPRPFFSSDATSVWPLRSIEESRLMQHFIQNLSAWVRL